MQTITKHYIDETFVESHDHEVMDVVNAASQILAGRMRSKACWAISEPRSADSSTRALTENSESSAEAFLEPRAILE